MPQIYASCLVDISPGVSSCVARAVNMYHPSFLNHIFFLWSLSWLLASLYHVSHSVNHHVPGIFFSPTYFHTPFSSYHPKYLSTTSPSSSLYPNYLLVCPNVFQDYHNSLLIIFPAFRVFSSNPFFTEQLELHI